MRRTAEKRLYDAHYAEIVRVYGEEAARTANIGWGTSETSICSKVYGPNGGRCTTYHTEDGEIEYHESVDHDGRAIGEE